MEEKHQKTIVAFVAGLLIGGLLVWVFSISPKAGEDVTGENGMRSRETGGTDTTPGAQNAASVSEAQGGGSIVIKDQAAGTRVAIESFDPPQDSGWIAIHDVNADGSLGLVLGAARFSETGGLMPKTVDLLRPMTAGATYHAHLYTDNGDRTFSIRKGDTLIEGVEGVFKAE